MAEGYATQGARRGAIGYPIVRWRMTALAVLIRAIEVSSRTDRLVESRCASHGKTLESLKGLILS